MRKSYRRIEGIDAARGIALIGMVLTHTNAVTAFENTSLTPIGFLFAGNSVALFIFLAGVSLQFIRSNQTLLIRSLILTVAGLCLACFPVTVAVILVNYGILFICLIPLRKVGTQLLVAFASFWLVASPFISFGLRTLLGPLAEQRLPSSASLFTAHYGWLNLIDLFLNGYYPILTFSCYALVGIVISRLQLSSPKTQGYLGLLGVVLYAAPFAISYASPIAELFGEAPINSFAWLNTMTAHAGTTGEIVHNLGYCFIVLAACMWLDQSFAENSARYLAPLTALGRITLTLYVVHCLLTTLTSLLWIHIVVLASIAALLWFFKKQGPLEFLLQQATKIKMAR